VRGLDPHLTVATLNLGTGKATQSALAQEAEFPRIDPRRVGLRHRQVVHATQIRPDLPGFGAVARTNVETGGSQRFSYGAQAMVEEHVFVPDGSKPGWVLGTVLDFGRRKTVLSCFAADHLAAGPGAGDAALCASAGPSRGLRAGLKRAQLFRARSRRRGTFAQGSTRWPVHTPRITSHPAHQPSSKRPWRKATKPDTLPGTSFGEGNTACISCSGKAWSPSTSRTLPVASDSLAT